MKRPITTLALAILLAGLLLVGTACGSPEPTPVPPEPTAAPAAQPEVTQPTATAPVAAPTVAVVAPTQPPPTAVAATPTQPEPTADAEELSEPVLARAEDINSYRSLIRYSTTGTKDGEPFEETVEIRLEFTRDPMVQYMISEMSGTEVMDDPDLEEGWGAFEFYQTSEQVYTKMGDQWMVFPASDDEDVFWEDMLFQADEFLEDTCGWKKERDTTIKGIAVSHWTLAKDAVEKCADMADLSGFAQVTDLGGDLYLAKDGGYVVQMRLYFDGADLWEDEEAGDVTVDVGRTEFYQETWDVNVPFVINIPDEALQASATPEDIPFPEDAQEINQMFGLITFNSASTPQKVADFYKEEMPNYDWKLTDDEAFGSFFSLSFTKENRTLSVTITEDGATGGTSVLMVVEE